MLDGKLDRFDPAEIVRVDPMKPARFGIGGTVQKVAHRREDRSEEIDGEETGLKRPLPHLQAERFRNEGKDDQPPFRFGFLEYLLDLSVRPYIMPSQDDGPGIGKFRQRRLRDFFAGLAGGV